MDILQRNIRIIISGGGTGGHIYPAIAIAEGLEERLENVEFLFVGSKGRMEMEKVPAAGYRIKGLWISGLQRKLSLKNLVFPLKLVHSIIKARKIIKDFKPHAVIGVGGYASGPTLYAAAKKGIPTLIQEQNAFPGITNKWLSKSVDRICVAHDGLEKYFPAGKIVKTGNPVRSNVISIKGKKEDAVSFFRISKEKKTVLVVGGSQGARSVNNAIKKMLGYFTEKDIQLIWQTGGPDFESSKSSVKEQHKQNVRVYDFIYDMDLAYAASDVIISRAGAIAMAEICAVGKPAIFIPLPTAAEDHQKKNAMALASKNAAEIVEDKEADQKLQPVLASIIEDNNKMKMMSNAVRSFAIRNGKEKIVDEIIKLIQQKHGGHK